MSDNNRRLLPNNPALSGDNPALFRDNPALFSRQKSDRRTTPSGGRWWQMHFTSPTSQMLINTEGLLIWWQYGRYFRKKYKVSQHLSEHEVPHCARSRVPLIIGHLDNH